MTLDPRTAELAAWRDDLRARIGTNKEHRCQHYRFVMCGGNGDRV
jgi:hypothetical protein